MLINGEASSQITVMNRGLAYGDGVFETFRIHAGTLLYADLHLQRLSFGCKRLGIEIDLQQVRSELNLALSLASPSEVVLKLIVTRSEGGRGRGYRPTSATSTRIISLHPLPAYPIKTPELGIHAFVCSLKLGLQPALAGIKHLNRLEQVLASNEWPNETYSEGVMQDINDYVVEGTRSNIFIVSQGQLMTPALDTCGIAGVMRTVLLDHFDKNVQIAQITLPQLLGADEVFFCNSVFGIWPLRSLTYLERHYEYKTGLLTLNAKTVFHKALSL